MFTNTCWRHARYGGGGGALHLPNSLIYKKSPKLLFASKANLKNWEFYEFFGQRNSLKFRKGPSFVRFAPSEAKKTPEFLQKCPHSKNQEEIHFWKMCTLLRQKSLVWAWLSSQMHRLRKQGLRELSPLNILSGGVGVSFSPPPQKILYP